MRPGCGNRVKTRGVCSGCYTAARRLVLDGATTWAELEKTGKVAPRRGRYGTKDWLFGDGPKSVADWENVLAVVQWVTRAKPDWLSFAIAEAAVESEIRRLTA